MDLLLQRAHPRSSTASTEPAAPLSSRLPSATAGIALGLCGAGSILSELHRLWGGPADGGTLVLTWMAAAAWLPFSLSRLCRRRVLAAELRVPSQIASYGAWQMVWQFLSLRLVYLASPTAARVLVAVGQALQLGLLVWFLAACWSTRTAPEPFWNPPTVNVAVSTIAGIGVGLPAGFSVGCFVLALFLQLALVPWQVWRVSCEAAVSASPAVAMMQAPCSLNALVWGVMRRDGTSAALLLGTPDLRVADRLTHALFGMATAVLWLTLLALWRRRTAIRKQVP